MKNNVHFLNQREERIFERSSTLIALAFVGQISHLGTDFFIFGLVLFPSLFFMGLVTFEWVLQATNTIIIWERVKRREESLPAHFPS